MLKTEIFKFTTDVLNLKFDKVGFEYATFAKILASPISFIVGVLLGIENKCVKILCEKNYNHKLRLFKT